MESISINPKILKSRRIQELDSLRGVAAVSVIFFHYTYGYDNGLKIISEDKFYFRYGYLGVQLFFIISGFVILMTLDNTNNYKKFIISRLSRLYPAYWLCILLTVLSSFLLNVPFQQNIYTFKQVLINFTMLQHFVKVKDVDGAYWTLAVELIFYFWIGLVVYTGKRHLLPFFCILWLSISILSMLGLIPYRNYIDQLLILPHAPFFVAGICFYLIKNDGSKIILHLIILVSFLVNMYMLQSNNHLLIPATIYCVIYIVFYLLILGKLNLIMLPTLLFLGKISYPLYLIHEVIGIAIIYWLRKYQVNQFFYVSIPLIIIIGIAYLIHRYWEIPALNLIRNYFFKRQII